MRFPISLVAGGLAWTNSGTATPTLTQIMLPEPGAPISLIALVPVLFGLAHRRRHRGQLDSNPVRLAQN